MKILHIIDSLSVGGAEMLLCNFIAQYKREQPDSAHYLITLKDDLSLLPVVKKDLEGNAVVKFTRARTLPCIAQIRRIVKRQKPDMIHTHLFYSTMLGRLAGGKVPVISTYHNMEYCKESPNYSGNYIFLDKLTFRRKKNFAIYVSNAVKACVQKGIPAQIGRSATIANFVSGDFSFQYEYRNNGELKLVAVGNLKKVKNHLYALREMAALKNPHISLDIYGEGRLEAELADYIQQNSLNVRLMGKTEINSSLLSKYDAFLLPSLSEGMPVSLIEAVITGMPSLVSDLPQLRETAEDTALYFSPVKDGSLASLLDNLYKNKDQLTTLSDNARRLASKYSWENYYNSIQKVYQQVVIRKQTPVEVGASGLTNPE